ncbi:MAG TPA: ABC-type transport auxiliary lipoprotein family protein [Caulobacteraceae bacterium]|jgi:cholesterol transport system auxiliary component|nr:ABC-type transport auxiliary lipoprotein family protein [Caulobacteraceae bacterium]
MSKQFLDRRVLLLTGLATGAAVTLGACGSNLIGPPDVAPPFYVLRPPPRTTAGGVGRPVPWQIAVGLPEAPDSLDTTRIVLVQPNGTMDFYANASWPDRLSVLVQSALIDALEGTGRMPAVGRDTDALKSDYMLETDIRDFQARYDQPDGIPTAVVRIEARLISLHGRTIVSSINAHSDVAAAENKVPAAVQALNTALGNTLGQIADWVLQAPSPKA